MNAIEKVPTNVERYVELARRSDANVLITGPTGTGKTRLARAIHDRGARGGKPFVAINLATLHEGTFEAELFGHERGAFTGADHRRTGRLEAAQGGTVFLDEIGELPPRLQARLLEVLQTGIISPMGANREIRLNVRFIAATHRDLGKAVVSREFREDLLHRLRVIPIQLKSLGERADEFDSIVHTMLEELCAASGRTVLRISPDVADRLESHSWPGNFRELRNVLEFAVLASDRAEIGLGDLPPWFSPGGAATDSGAASALGVAEFPLPLDYQGAISRFEKEFLKRALERYRGRVNLTAREIGLSKATLIRRMRIYGLAAREPASGAAQQVFLTP